MNKRLTTLSIVVLWVLSSFFTSVSPIFAQDWSDLSSDLDGDGLLDELETDGWYSEAGGRFFTDPQDADSDDDGLTDGEEKLYGTHPQDDESPGIYVRYEDAFYTKEYFSVTDPDYLSVRRAGDRWC